MTWLPKLHLQTVLLMPADERLGRAQVCQVRTITWRGRKLSVIWARLGERNLADQTEARALAAIERGQTYDARGQLWRQSRDGGLVAAGPALAVKQALRVVDVVRQNPLVARDDRVRTAMDAASRWCNIAFGHATGQRVDLPDA